MKEIRNPNHTSAIPEIFTCSEKQHKRGSKMNSTKLNMTKSSPSHVSTKFGYFSERNLRGSVASVPGGCGGCRLENGTEESEGTLPVLAMTR